MSHAAIVAGELGIPVVVGYGNATLRERTESGSQHELIILKVMTINIASYIKFWMTGGDIIFYVGRE